MAVNDTDLERIFAKYRQSSELFNRYYYTRPIKLVTGHVKIDLDSPVLRLELVITSGMNDVDACQIRIASENDPATIKAIRNSLVQHMNNVISNIQLLTEQPTFAEAIQKRNVGGQFSLSEEQQAEARQRHIEGETLSTIAQSYNVSKMTISRLVRGVSRSKTAL